MIIAFDIQSVLLKKKTGIGFCALGWINNFIKANAENKYILRYFTLHNETEHPSYDFFYYNNVSENHCNWMNNEMAKLIWTIFPLPYHLFFSAKADVSFFFNYFVPPFVSGKKVVVIHDMSFKVYPETSRLRTRSMMKINLTRSCKRADHIVTVSEFSKQEILKYMNIAPEKVSVIYPACDPKIFNTALEPSIDIIQKKYNIPKRYLLYLGTLEPRKNIRRLIQAYSQAKKNHLDLPPLVVAGKKGWLYQDIFNEVIAQEMINNIIFTGYLPDKEIIGLLKGATAFLFPSLYEGFGMPVLEAMACGTPVLTSDCSSLPEVVDTAAILVDPLSVDSIREGIEDIAFNETLRQKLSKEGLQQAKKFTWAAAVTKLTKICLMLEEKNE